MKIPFIVAHPHALRSREFFEEGYSKQKQQEDLEKLINAFALLNKNPDVRVCLENKPNPG